MTLKVVVELTDPEHDDRYPVFYALNDGVRVGTVGELMLVSERHEVVGSCAEVPCSFRIYAPGAWKEINVEHIVDE